MRRSLGLVTVAAALLVAAGAPVGIGPTSTDADAPDAEELAAPDARPVPAPTSAPATSIGPTESWPPVDDADAARDGRITTGGAAPVPDATDIDALLRAASGATTVAVGSAAAGSGPAHRFSVEAEPTLDLDLDEVVRIVESALFDTERSWARDRTLLRVADPAQARIRIIIAAPDAVDAICATVGLNTAGIYSCWTGRIAALNSMRWASGATGFDDLDTYRTYLINHEVGHAFGYGHEGCPGDGEPAPVMMQQSKGVGGCVANGWPHP